MRLLTPHQLGVPGSPPGGEADVAALDGFYLLALEKAGPEGDEGSGGDAATGRS